jgi:hypothetical protein
MMKSEQKSDAVARAVLSAQLSCASKSPLTTANATGFVISSPFLIRH